MSDIYSNRTGNDQREIMVSSYDHDVLKGKILINFNQAASLMSGLTIWLTLDEATALASMLNEAVTTTRKARS